MDDDEDYYIVCPLNWEKDEKHGILVHTTCYKFLKNLIPNLDDKKLFSVMKECVNKFGFALNNIDYFGIEKNWEQDYQLRDNEEHFVTSPEKVFLPKDIKKGLKIPENVKIPTFLPTELQMLIFEFLDAKGLCSASTICKYWYKLGSNDELWKKLFEMKYKPFGKLARTKWSNWKNLYIQSLKEPSMRNRERIIKCVEQIRAIYENKRKIDEEHTSSKKRKIEN